MNQREVPYSLTEQRRGISIYFNFQDASYPYAIIKNTGGFFGAVITSFETKGKAYDFIDALYDTKNYL